MSETLKYIYNDLVKVMSLFQENTEKAKVIYCVYLIYNRWFRDLEEMDPQTKKTIDEIKKVLTNMLNGTIFFKDIPENIIALVDTMKKNHSELGRDERDHNETDIMVLKENHE